jgi:endo-1,4-beta-mannosidase
MNRRKFLTSGAGAALTAALASEARESKFALGSLQATPVAAAPLAREPVGNHLTRHRFGVNYTPSHNWWFCWNEWNTDPIKRDLDAIQSLGADHLRLMLIWPYFQPNLTWVSQAHIERLSELLGLMAERNLDALITVFTGQLSGWFFLPPFNRPDPALYTDPELWKSQELFVRELARIMTLHSNVIGFDFGNEMNTCWKAPTAVGDAWMSRMFALMNQAHPQGVHVNGVDHHPWFMPDTFSPHALAAKRFPVIHAYPWWAEALKYGGPMDPPSTHILAAFAALVRSYAGDAQKPVWAGEFNTCIEALPEKGQAEWLDKAVTAGIEGGVSWFTYWDSHDVDRKFEFNSLEYSLGLLTNDGRIKQQGRVFKELAQAYRGKPVNVSSTMPKAPPADQTMDGTWKWLLDNLGWKARQS